MHCGMQRWLRTTCWSSNWASHRGERGIELALNRLVWVFPKLLIHWDFHNIQTSPGFTESVSQKRESAIELQLCFVGKRIADVRAQNSDSQLWLWKIVNVLLLFFSSYGLFHWQWTEEKLTHRPEAHSVSSMQFFYSYSNAFSHTCTLLLPANFSFEAKQPCGETLQRTLWDPHTLWRDSHILSEICCSCFIALCACAWVRTRHWPHQTQRNRDVF